MWITLPWLIGCVVVSLVLVMVIIPWVDDLLAVD